MVLRRTPTTITNPEINDAAPALPYQPPPSLAAPVTADWSGAIDPNAVTPYFSTHPAYMSYDPTTGLAGEINPTTGQQNQPMAEGGVPTTLTANPSPPILTQPGTGDPYFGLGAPPDPNDLSGMESDPAYAALQRRLQQALARQQSQTGEDIASTQADIGNRRNLLQTQHPTDIKNLLENFAGRGMAFSGRYATDQGDMENQYAGALSGLDTEQASRISAIQRALSNMQADQGNQLEDAKLAYVRSKAAQSDAYSQALAAAKAKYATA